MSFMSKQVSVPKISLILLKMKIGPKSDINALFARKPSNDYNTCIVMILDVYRAPLDNSLIAEWATLSFQYSSLILHFFLQTKLI